MDNNLKNNALEQYRNLLGEYAEKIAANTAPAIAGKREDAANVLIADKSVSFPKKGSDGFEYTDLNEMFAPDLGVNIARVLVTTDAETVFRCSLPAVSALLGITVNDTFQPTERMKNLMPEGVTVTTFAEASDAEQAVIRRYYGTMATAVPERPATLLNTALAQDGILVYVKEGVNAEKPIQLVNILETLETPDGTKLPVLAVRRILIVIEKNASAQVLICDHDRSNDKVSASNRVTEVCLGENSKLDLYELEENTGMTSRYTRTVVRQGTASHLAVFSATLKPGHTRNDFEIHLDGEGASATLNGMEIADGSQVADNSATVHHHVPHCFSNQKFKYLVSDEARGAFEGLIRVDHGAKGTDAYQNDHNILGGPHARMHARPQLEIYCDDVKCSHGAATGQLDEQALFYMRSRGIDLPEARSMLMNAFMADVIDGVALTPLCERLKFLVERRLSGDDARCQGCPGK